MVQELSRVLRTRKCGKEDLRTNHCSNGSNLPQGPAVNTECIENGQRHQSNGVQSPQGKGGDGTEQQMRAPVSPFLWQVPDYLGTPRQAPPSQNTPHRVPFCYDSSSDVTDTTGVLLLGTLDIPMRKGGQHHCTISFG